MTPRKTEFSNEAQLVGAIQAEIAKRYPAAWQFKVVGSPYQMTGVPDILVCVEGMLIGIEAKHQKPGESREHALSRVTPTQRVQIMRINRAGGMAGAALTVEDALDIIERGLKHRDDIRARAQVKID